MIYLIYLFLLLIAIFLIDYKIPIKAIYLFVNFLCNNFIAKHIIKMIGLSLLNIGNAALFFSMSGYLVVSLGVSLPNLTMLGWYGIIMTVSGYILGNCKEVKNNK